MMPTLLLSLTILCAALAWSIVLLRRQRDWRLAPLALIIASATLRQGLTLRQLVGEGDWGRDPVAELLELLMSALMLFLVITLDRLLDDLRRSDTRLRGLTDRLRRTQQDQESRIQRHLHDELAQLLSSLKIDLVWLAGRTATAPAEVGARITSMQALLDAAVQTVRRFAAGLNPPWLEDMGLAASIEAEATVLEARCGCSCTIHLPPEPLDAAPDRDRSVLQVLRESFDNIAQHAAARSVSVRLSRGEELLELEVRDDGRGIDPRSIEDGRSLGVAEMRECARAAGGWLEIQPSLEGGTVVRLCVPPGDPMPIRSAP